MAETDQERNEEATQQRREDFRKRGQVAQTKELASVLTLLSVALLLWILGRFLLVQVSDLIAQSMTSFVVAAAREGDYIPAVIFGAKKSFLYRRTDRRNFNADSDRSHHFTSGIFIQRRGP